MRALSAKVAPLVRTHETRTVVRIAELAMEHARRCKLHYGTCRTCRANEKWFAELPPQQLAVALQEANPVRRDL